MSPLLDLPIPQRARSLAGNALVPAWRLLFKVAGAQRTTLGDQLDTVLGPGLLGRRFRAMQVRSEISALLELLSRRPPKTVLEIGTANGGTLWLLSRVAAPDALLVSVDLPRTAATSGYADWREHVYGDFGRAQQRIRLVRGDSHRDDVRATVTSALEGRPVDFLLIDGDHSYEGAKTDFEMYSPLIADDGLIAFHDIVPGEDSRVGGVPRLWSELREQRPRHEFVESWQQGGFGIGVLDPRNA